MGCHFLLQCMKVKSESEVAQLRLTLSDPMDCSLPGSSVHGFSRQEYWSGVPLPSPWLLLLSLGDLSDPEIKPAFALASRFFTTEPPGKPLYDMYVCVYIYMCVCVCVCVCVYCIAKKENGWSGRILVMPWEYENKSIWHFMHLKARTWETLRYCAAGLLSLYWEQNRESTDQVKTPVFCKSPWLVQVYSS